MSEVVRCAKCGAPLTPDERFLHAIFGTCHIADDDPEVPSST